MQKIIDLTGEIFSKLTVLNQGGRDKHRHVLWECVCKCGNKKTTSGNSLRRGLTRSCGCLVGEQARSESGRERQRNRCLGKKLSEDHKKKISDSLKGKPTWNKGKKWTTEQKKNLQGRDVWNKGKVCPSISKRQLGKPKPWLKGRKRSKEMVDKISGSNHYNWQGGITSINKKIRNSLGYKIWRKAVFERDNYTCQECDQRGGELNADHIKSFATHIKLRFVLSNGRTLCLSCHKKTDSYGRPKHKIKQL